MPILPQRPAPIAQVIQVLCDAGAPVDARDDEVQTPLHYAVLCEQRAAAVALVVAGADPHAVAADGQTPAKMAPVAWECWPSR